MGKFILKDLETEKEYEVQDFDIQPEQRFIVKFNVGESILPEDIPVYVKHFRDSFEQWIGKEHIDKFAFVPVRKPDDFMIFEVKDA